MNRNQRIGRILHVANSNPTEIHFDRAERFYCLKQFLCESFASTDGVDYQHIRKECWECDGNVTDQRFSQTLAGKCYKCGGSGIYSERIVKLQRYQLGDFTFHKPCGTIVGAKPTIEGLIRHRPSPLAHIAFGALAMLFKPELIYPIFNRVNGKAFERLVVRSAQVAKWINQEEIPF